MRYSPLGYDKELNITKILTPSVDKLLSILTGTRALLDHWRCREDTRSNRDMQYTFSWGSFFIGTLILIVGGCIVVWHRQLSDMFSDDIGSYSRYQMWGFDRLWAGPACHDQSA